MQSISGAICIARSTRLQRNSGVHVRSPRLHSPASRTIARAKRSTGPPLPESSRKRIARSIACWRDLPFDALCILDLGNSQVIGGLKIQPRVRVAAEAARKPHGGIGAEAAPARTPWRRPSFAGYRRACPERKRRARGGAGKSVRPRISQPVKGLTLRDERRAGDRRESSRFADRRGSPPPVARPTAARGRGDSA